MPFLSAALDRVKPSATIAVTCSSHLASHLTDPMPKPPTSRRSRTGRRSSAKPRSTSSGAAAKPSRSTRPTRRRTPISGSVTSRRNRCAAGSTRTSRRRTFDPSRPSRSWPWPRACTRRSPRRVAVAIRIHWQAGSATSAPSIRRSFPVPATTWRWFPRPCRARSSQTTSLPSGRSSALAGRSASGQWSRVGWPPTWRL